MDQPTHHRHRRLHSTIPAILCPLCNVVLRTTYDYITSLTEEEPGQSRLNPKWIRVQVFVFLSTPNSRLFLESCFTVIAAVSIRVNFPFRRALLQPNFSGRTCMSVRPEIKY